MLEEVREVRKKMMRSKMKLGVGVVRRERMEDRCVLKRESRDLGGV